MAQRRNGSDAIAGVINLSLTILPVWQRAMCKQVVRAKATALISIGLNRGFDLGDEGVY